MAPEIRILTYSDLQANAVNLADAIKEEGREPEVIVAITRGGLVPAGMLCHHLGVRDVRALAIAHTEHDGVDAPKTVHPVVHLAESLGDLTGRDVLIVDDVAGTGKTLDVARAAVSAAGAHRVSMVVFALNEANWPKNRDGRPDYVGVLVNCWVEFPWE